MSIFKSVITWLSPTAPKKEPVELWNQNLLGSNKVDETSRIKFIPPEEQYIIKINGKYYVFGSKEEMPENLRRGVETVENSDSAVSIYTVIRNGVRETFFDANELPLSVRRMLEKSNQLDSER